MIRLQDEPCEGTTQVLNELKALVGFPARIVLRDSRTPGNTVKIPGIIRQVALTGIVLELFFPLICPRTGESAALEVIGHSSLTQGFTTITHTSNPQCIHLMLPDKIHAVQRRRFPRANVFISARLQHPAFADGKPVTITNLSAGGCALELTEPLKVGDKVHLNLLAAGLSPADIAAEVARCSPSPSPDGVWDIGLAFCSLDGAGEQHLVNYVNMLI
jgi:hypothetical protein